MTPATSFDLDSYITHHLSDSQEWHIPFLPTIHIPEFISLHVIMLLICSIILFVLFVILYDKKSRVPKGITNLLEIFIIFIRDEIAIAYLGEKDGKKMAPLFCNFFFFILILNIMGLIPLFSTATANINVTAALALITFFFMIFGTIYKNGIQGFFKALIPSGVPIPVLFLLVPIEFIGLFIKSFALTIRLFANMLAGHIVILSLLGIVVLMGFAALPIILLALGISLLEVLVAFLQAYIFTLLSAMFIGQMHHPEH